MDVKEAMYRRRSIRKYKPDPVSNEDIDTLLHYAMSGPSACNKCPWEFYVVRNEGLMQELRKASRYTNYTAPVILIVAGNTKRALPLQMNDYWIQDCSAAIENILLGAVSLGLGTCWCGLKPQVRATKKVQQILGMESHIVPLGLIHLGYPVEQPEARDQYDEKRVHRFE
ncbi:MAG: nitroreductase family protein [Angelakisella sp.]